MFFNIDDHPGNVVMHCKTMAQAESFCQYLHDHGRTWCTGETYLDHNNWGGYGTNMAYRFNDGRYGDIEYYKGENFTILEWADFMNLAPSLHQ